MKLSYLSVLIMVLSFEVTAIEVFGDGCNPANQPRCVCALFGGKKICKSDAKSTNNTAALKDITDIELLTLLQEIENERKQIIGAYYDKEMTEIQQNDLFASYYEKLDRANQLGKLKALQDERNRVHQAMAAEVGNHQDEPFYSLNKRLEEINAQYKALEDTYLAGLVNIEKKVEEQVKEARARLASQGMNDDWELFKIADTDYFIRMQEIEADETLSAVEKQKAMDSLVASLVDIQNMAISVNAIKHLRCVPYDEATKPESYTLFRSGAAMFIAAQINQTTDQKLSIKKIEETDIDPEIEQNQQLKNLKLVSILNEQQISSVDLRHASKSEAFKIFRNAYIIAQHEYETKMQKLAELQDKIDGAEELYKYHDSKGDRWYCGICRALSIHCSKCRRHRRRERIANAKLEEWNKLKELYEKHGHLKCHAENTDGMDVPSTVIGQRNTRETLDGIEKMIQQKVYAKNAKSVRLFYWLQMKGFAALNRDFSQGSLTNSIGKFKATLNKYSIKTSKSVLDFLFSQAHAESSQTEEQGLAMKKGAANFEYFMATKEVELFNKAASSSADCSGIPESEPRGQVQAFPYPCHRVEYLAHIKDITKENSTDMATTEKDTAIDRRNTYVSLLHHNRQRMSVNQGTANKGIGNQDNVIDVDTPKAQAVVIESKQLEGAGGGFSSGQNINLPSGLNSFSNANIGTTNTIEASEQKLADKADKARGGSALLVKRSTQRKINTRRRILDKILKKSPNSKFFRALRDAGGSFNKKDVAIADAMNAKAGEQKTGIGSGSGRGAGNSYGNNANAKTDYGKQANVDRDKLLNKLLNNSKYQDAKKSRNRVYRDYSSRNSRRKSKTKNSIEVISDDLDDIDPISGMTKREKLRMFKEINSGTATQPNKGDSIFRKITKAYFRKALPVLLELGD